MKKALGGDTNIAHWL